MSRSGIAQSLGALAILVMSCDVSFQVPLGRQVPTAAPGAVETIVAGTAGAAQTQTAALAPPTATITLTPTASHTPSLTPTLTPTFVFYLRSPVPARTSTPAFVTVSAGYSCNLLGQDPADGTQFKPNAKFDAAWELRNTGGSAWNADNVDFAYATGRKMYENETIDLPRDVQSGESVRLVVHMAAPKVLGSYKTVWTLQRGGKDFCHVDLTIVVK